MTNGWQTVQLGEVLKQDVNYVTELEPKIYPKLSVKLYGKGVVLDAPTDGANVKMQRHQFAKPGQIILSEIWAKKGAIGIVPKDGEGALVTSHFFLFDVDETKVLRDWVGLLLKRNYFADTLDSQARGTTGYAAVRPKQFLALEIPLPPLTEQRRIVAHIESLAARVNEAQRLREEADVETQAYINSALNHLLVAKEHWTTKAITDVSTMSTGTTPPSQRIDYYGGEMQWYTPGDLSFEKELGKSSRTVSDIAIKENKVRIFQPGTILLVAIGGTLGKVSLARTPCSSNQQITGILFNEDIFPDYGFWWMRRLYHDLRNAAPQATLPIINQRRIGEFEISFPPLPEQRRISEYLDGLQSKINSLRNLQSETEQELNALLPSVLDKAFKGEL